MMEAAYAMVEGYREAFLVHERGVVILANRAAARLVGAASREQLIGRDVATYLGTPPSRFGDSLTELFAEDGSRRPVLVRERPFFLGGRPRRALLIVPLDEEGEPARACPL
jgi:PAS domain-containing protein